MAITATIAERTFRAFATFHHLTHIKINVGLSIALLNDELIEEMAARWPNAESIQLQHYPTSIQAAKVTFKGLASLVQHCPRLKQIMLSLTATTPHPNFLDSIINSKVANNNVGHFDLSWSTIETSNTSMVAQFSSPSFRSYSA